MSTRTPAARSVPQTPAAGLQDAPALLLARAAVGDGDGRFWVNLGGQRREAGLDPAVDPALVAECLETGAPLIVTSSGDAITIVGALATRRALSIDPNGDVEARIRRLRLTLAEEGLLRTASAFLRLRGAQIDLLAGQLSARTREVLRLMGRTIKIN